MISFTPFSIFLFWSVSSILKINTPPLFFAKLSATRHVKTPPMCKNPVGLGAKRVTIAPGFKSLFGYLFSKSSLVNVTSGNNKSANFL